MTSRTEQTGGFTLIEMMVVIAMLGLVLGLLAQYGAPKSRWLETKGAAAKVAAAMITDRGRAITGGEPVPLVLPRLPAWLGVTIAAPPGGIVFEPDGSATGGRVLLNPGGRAIAVIADWLTGRVRIEPP